MSVPDGRFYYGLDMQLVRTNQPDAAIHIHALIDAFEHDFQFPGLVLSQATHKTAENKVKQVVREALRKIEDILISLLMEDMKLGRYKK